MKKYVYIIWVCFLFSFSLIQGQECGSVPNQQQLAALQDSTSLFNRRLQVVEDILLKDLPKIQAIEPLGEQFIVKRAPRFSTSSGAPVIQIPIVAHILRRSNGRDGLSVSDLYASVERTNKLYSPIRVHFHVCQIKFIDNDNLFTFNYDSADDKVGKMNANAFANRVQVRSRNVDGKLNIYFVERSDTSWSKFPTKSGDGQHIVMRNQHARNKSTLAHEIGHWFNLIHTHGSKGIPNETPNQLNCLWAGDFCCDTPADPKLSDSTVDNNCNYTGNERGPGGKRYDPDPTNIMSYSRKECRNGFSERQTRRMFNSYLGMNSDRGYTFDVCNEIGHAVQTLDWSNGWDNTVAFKMGATSYLFLLKSKTGDVHVNRINNDGKIGSRIFDKKWSSGWTSSKIIVINDRTKYLFLLKKSTGDVHVNKINADGTIGAKVFDKKWSTGWDNVEILSTASGKYLFLLKKGSGDVHIHKINNNGTIGEKIFDKKWSTGWDITNVIQIEGTRLLMLYKSDTGDIHVHPINKDGIPGPRKFDKRWSKGWSAMTQISRLDGIHHTLHLKASNGHLKSNLVTRISNYVGPVTYDNVHAKLGGGYSQLVHYTTSSASTRRSFLLVLKSSDGKGLVYELTQ